TADNTITVANARSTAILGVPGGATITYARLYWSATLNNAASGAADTTVTLDRPGGATTTVTADSTWIADGTAPTARYYQGSADVTAFVVARGNGATLSNADNPANNFFNRTRSSYGVNTPNGRVTVAGDLPQPTGASGSMDGLDLDFADVTAYVAAGQTSATVQCTSNLETYLLG